MLFVGAYAGMEALAKLSPLDKIVTVLAGAFAAVIWMAHYNRGLLYSLWILTVSAAFYVVNVGSADRRLTAFGITRGTAGIKPGKSERKMGLGSATTAAIRPSTIALRVKMVVSLLAISGTCEPRSVK